MCVTKFVVDLTTCLPIPQKCLDLLSLIGPIDSVDQDWVLLNVCSDTICTLLGSQILKDEL